MAESDRPVLTSPTISAAVPHISVLLQPALDSLNVTTHPDGLFIDGTVGAGGHSAAILKATDKARLLGFDRDLQALAITRERLAQFGERVTLIHANYDQMGVLAAQNGFAQVDGILLDLGISSMQVDQAQRGFAFRADGPLDMRMNPDSDEPTAADLVNTLTESALADILYQYGEEHDSRRIARAILAARPISTTKQLAEIIAGAIPASHRQKIHPATRSFQALRIAVNDELGGLERVLPAALDLLKPGGRLAVISFHSLEDRIVKQYFKHESTDCVCPPKQIVCTCGHVGSINLITRKPISADDAEVAANPRSRSAQLRIAQKR